jgi:hypothetical protein
MAPTVKMVGPAYSSRRLNRPRISSSMKMKVAVMIMTMMMAATMTTTTYDRGV